MTRLLYIGLITFWVLVGCQTTAPVDDRDGAPSNHVDLSGVPDAVPKVRPLSKLGNHSPYVVFGKRYRVLDTATGYQATGVASWYGSKFHGRLTSSGQPYDMYRMTAAHRSLPLPSYVEVSNLENGRSVVVEVNDRGPFREGRIIDLSYAAAVRLGFVHEGVTRVRLEALDPSSPARGDEASMGSQAGEHVTGARPISAEPDAAGSLPAAQPGSRLFLQAGAFATSDAAAGFSDVLKDVVGDRVRIVRFPSQDELHRVRVGPIGDLEEASRLQALIITANLGVPLIIYD